MGLPGTKESNRGAQPCALMGVLNVTPDSFYDGGALNDPSSACEKVDALLGEGADIIDIGGESSRPGSTPVPPSEQIARIDAPLRHGVARGAVISVDTTSPTVADHALSVGAAIINDVSCLTNVDLARVVAEHPRAILIVMHCRGRMEDMRGFSDWPDDAYGDVVDDVVIDWEHARDRALSAGLAPSQLWCDPGLGFAKNARQSFELLARLGEFRRLGVPLVIGPGRKSFIAAVDPSTPTERLGGTIAASLVAADAADVIRVHDVRAVKQALAVTAATRRFTSPREATHA